MVVQGISDVVWGVSRKAKLIIVCIVLSIIIGRLNAVDTTDDTNSSGTTTLVLSCNPPVNLDCEGADLTGRDLSGMDLNSAKLSNTNLTNADLTNANLTNANLSNASLIGTNLTGSNLVGANLSNAILFDANLS